MFMVANWTFLARRARALPCIAYDPEVRVRDFGQPGITERSAYRTVTYPAEAGYEVNQKNGRRNRYQTRAHLPLPEPGSQERTAGDVLALLAGTTRGRNGALPDRRMIQAAENEEQD
jgi:hypothetical protein